MTYPSQHAGAFYNWSQSNGFSFLYLITFRSVFNIQMSGGEKKSRVTWHPSLFLKFQCGTFNQYKGFLTH